MSNRIDTRFATLSGNGVTALVPFITVGDPDPAWMVEIMHALVKAGANLLELGVPFCAPVADGPVIQMASERALSRGVTPGSVLDTVKTFRERDSDTPIVLMTYPHPIEHYGHAAFAGDAAGAGVDGVLTVDYPPEKTSSLHGRLAEQGIYSICLLTPTTGESLGRIVRQARGYLYYASYAGVTGANKLDVPGLTGPVNEIRLHSGLPIAVGFGIKTAAHAAAVAGLADAVVIGSALVEQLQNASSCEVACARAVDFLAPIRHAMDNRN